MNTLKFFQMLPRPLAVLLTLSSSSVVASECAIDIESTDRMRFSVEYMEISAACESYTVSLTHTGRLPKQSMGHNWVLTKTADARPVALQGIRAGLSNQYLTPGDERVIAFTEMIGGGETTSITFSTAGLSKEEDYTFFCSFPGHLGLMKGVLKFVD